MALVRLDAEEAFTVQNQARKWPSAGGGAEFLRPVVRTAFNPRIKIARDDKIFALGSCFAREIEAAAPEWLNMPRVQTEDAHAQNKYNVMSILNQIRWSYGLADIEESFSGIMRLNSKWHTDYHAHRVYSAACSKTRIEDDPALATKPLAGSLEEITTSRRLLNRHFENIRGANAFIITLGLAEVWYDRETGLYLNNAPSPYAVKLYPGRFEFQQLSYDDVIACLESIYTVLDSQVERDLKILITVSPIPYTSTFTPMVGAIEGNCYSKSVQRAAVESFKANHKNVAYFPSYEMAIYSDNQFVWKADNVHVREEFAQYITAHALSCILSDDLLEEHPEISTRNVDYKMLDLISGLGLTEFVRRFVNRNESLERQVTDLAKTAPVLQKRLERAEARGDQGEILIKSLLHDRERLVAQNNVLLAEQLRAQLATEDKHEAG